MRFNKILRPLDGSKLAEAALAPALALAEALSAEIVLLNYCFTQQKLAHKSLDAKHIRSYHNNERHPNK